MKKKPKNNNFFAIFSILAIGSYYSMNPDLFIPQNNESLLNKDDPNSLKSQAKKPQDPLKRVTSTLSGQGSDVTFDQWLNTSESTSAYDAWRKSPSGVKALGKTFKESNEFKKGILNWARSTKRDIKEFKRIVKKESKYKNDFLNWKVSDEGASQLKNHYLNDVSFATKSRFWIDNGNFSEDSQNYLQSPKAKSDYDSWIKKNNNIAKMETSWKSSVDYSLQKDAWLRKVNAKDSKEAWLSSNKGQKYIVAWKGSNSFSNQIKTFWKASSNYQEELRKWLLASPNKTTLEKYKNNDLLWEDSFNKFKASPSGNQIIEDSVKLKSEFLNKKQEWVQAASKRSINQDLFTNYYASWIQKAEATTSLKPEWLKSQDYVQKKNSWVQNNYNGDSLQTWKSNTDLNPLYEKWKTSSRGRRALQDEWKKTANYTQAKNTWANRQDTIDEHKEIWKKLPETLNPWINWVARPENDQLSKNHWVTTNYYTKSKDKWILANPINRPKSVWVTTDDAKNTYNTWKTTTIGTRDLTKAWKNSADYTTKREQWAATNFNFIGKDQWFNSQVAKATTTQEWDVLKHQKAYVEYIDKTSDDLVAEFQKSAYYQSKKTTWVNNAYQKQLWKDYILLDDAKNAYNTWKQTSEGDLHLKDKWKESSDYKSKKSAWEQNDYNKISFQNWKDSDDALESYEKWKESNAGTTILKQEWKQSPDYATKKQEWANQGSIKRSIDSWASDDDSTNDYISWSTSDDARSKLEKVWNQESDAASPYVIALNNWFNTNHQSLDTKEKWVDDASSDAAFEKWYADQSLSYIQQQEINLIFDKEYEKKIKAYTTLDDWLASSDGFWKWVEDAKKLDKNNQNHKTKEDVYFYEGDQKHFIIGKNILSYPQAIMLMLGSQMYPDSAKYGKDLFADLLANQGARDFDEKKWANLKRFFAEMQFNFRSDFKRSIMELVKMDMHNYFTKWPPGTSASKMQPFGNHQYAKANYWFYAGHVYKNHHPDEYQIILKKYLKKQWKKDANATSKAYLEYKQKEFKKATSDYNQSLDAWSATKANGINLYKKTSDAKVNYNGWNDPNPIATTLQNYDSNYMFNQDYNAYLNQLGANGKGVGLNLYLNNAQAQNDYNSWVDPNAYDQSTAFLNDFITYRDAAKWRADNGYYHYLKTSDAKKDYRNWNDPKAEADYLKSFQFYIDIKKYYQFNDQGISEGKAFYKSSGAADSDYDQKLNDKKNQEFSKTTKYSQDYNNWINSDAGFSAYKRHWISNNHYDAWNDPNPNYPSERDYRNDSDFNSDFATWAFTKESTYGKTLGFLFYATQVDGIAAFNNWLLTNKNKYYDRGSSFQKDFDAFLTKSFGMSAYEASSQINKDYQKWYNQQGESAYQTDAQFNVDLANWSKVLANGFATYQKNNQYLIDKPKVLAAEFLKSQTYLNLLNQLKATYGKAIYKNSQTFIDDYNNWIDPKVRVGNKYDLSLEFNKDFNSYKSKSNNVLAAYNSLGESNTNYNNYVNDLKGENDYLASQEKSKHLTAWGSVFDNGKNVFKNDPFFVNLIKRDEKKYQNSQAFKNDFITFIKTTNYKYFNDYVESAHVKRLYKKWDDPVGVAPVVEDYEASKHYLEKNLDWSKNKNNGFALFKESAFAQLMFNKWKQEKK